MVKKSLRQFTLMATATVTLLLGSVPLYAQTADVQQKLAELEFIISPLAYGELQSRKADAIVEINYLNSRYSRD
ncbi:Beta-lactamase [Klebsiella pneumoniae]|uniref:hypothetical protein n=1 Tax=Klebsiella pneumoniae TaxID=573 RepID=UPI000E2AA171|nr:hypothetical protein [Klebsiella pneumoniae]SXV54095.1 Beta-lactamase [Klebsiella pneumoniae]